MAALKSFAPGALAGVRVFSSEQEQARRLLSAQRIRVRGLVRPGGTLARARGSNDDRQRRSLTFVLNTGGQPKGGLLPGGQGATSQNMGCGGCW